MSKSQSLTSPRSRSLAINCLLIFLLILPATIPLFNTAFFPMHDYTHVARVAELDRGLKAGIVPARWSENFGFGYGMPLLHFYSPLPYYMAEAIAIVGISPTVAIKLIFYLNFFLGFLFMFWLSKEFFGKWGGVLSALAFVYAPYRSVQFYVRGALAEMLATTFIPLALWCLFRVCKSFEGSDSKDRIKWILGSGFSIAAVFLSHNVIALFSLAVFIPWTLIWFYFYGVYKQKLSLLKGFKQMGVLILTALCALGLSAWFIIPAFFEKKYTIVDTIGGGLSFYKLHFVYIKQFFSTYWAYGGSILGPYDQVSFQFGLAQLGLCLFSIIALIFIFTRKRVSLLNQFLGLKQIRFSREQIIVVTFSCLSLIVVVFMMTTYSTPVWELIKIIQIAQFPWRFLSLGILFIAIIGGISGMVLEQFGRLGWAKITAALLGLGLIIVNVGFFKPESYERPDKQYYTDPKRIQTELSGILTDYQPIWVKETPNPGLAAAALISGVGEIKRIEKTYGSRKIDINAPLGAKLEVRTFYFPGWQAYVDSTPIPIKHSDISGLIQLDIPPGKHQVEVKLTKTPIQRWSDIATVSTIIGMAIGVFYFLNPQLKKTSKIS